MAIKSISRRKWLTWSLMACVPSWAWAQGAAVSAAEWRELIKQATRLSILTDRITRAHVQRHLQVLPSRADRVLIDSLAEARQLLSVLSQAPGSRSVGAVQGASEREVAGFLEQAATVNSSDRGAVVRLADRADQAGDVVDQWVGAYLGSLGQAEADVLRVTANLQRLTQHLAVHFLLAKAGVAVETQMREVQEGRQAFEAGLSALKQSPFRQPRIVSDLALLENQWLFMRNALTAAAADAAALQNAATTSERTLEALNDLYTQYEGVLRSA